MAAIDAFHPGSYGVLPYWRMLAEALPLGTASA
jgi:hypothetical protein